MLIIDKIRGCLIGGAAGDALGNSAWLEAGSAESHQDGKNGITEYVLQDGKTLISDDTQMSLFTANGLLYAHTRGKLRGFSASDVSYIHQAYLDWLLTQGATDTSPHISWLLDVDELRTPRAPGKTCMEALSSGIAGSMAKPLNQSKGCGGVMRTAPIGLFRGYDQDAAFFNACKAAALTHGHKLGWLPAGVLARVLHRIVFGGVGPAEALYDSINQMLIIFPYEESRQLAERLYQAVYLTSNDHPDADNIRLIGEGRTGDEVLAVAVYSALKYQQDFDRAIICAVNHSSCSDSAGAVTGNLAGAINGYDRIDSKWTLCLELHDVILEMADDLFLAFPEELSDDNGCFRGDWTHKYIDCRRPAPGKGFADSPCGAYVSAVEQEYLQKALATDDEEEFERYLKHVQNLPPRLRACIGYIMNESDSPFVPHSMYLRQCSKIEFPLKFFGYAGEHSDIGACYRINRDAFLGRFALFLYIDDELDSGELRAEFVSSFCRQMEKLSSGLSRFMVDVLGDDDGCSGYAILFHLDSAAIKDSVMIGGREIPASESGGYVLVIPKAGEFTANIVELTEKRPVSLEMRNFCMK